ncbi:MAG: hypothetical protein ACREBD_27350 [Blastocatellia bacterium]
MASLQDINHGKVFTHLIALLTEVEAALRRGDASLEQIAGWLDRDEVYIAISEGAFVAPVRQSRKIKELRERVESIRRLIADSKGRRAALEPFLKTIERFLDSGGGAWQQKYGYFIVPVIGSTEQLGEQSGEQSGGQPGEQPGLVYLRSLRKQRMQNVAQRRLNIEDLTQDPRLIGYFDSLAVVLMKRFFFVRHYPYDPYTGLADFSYPLHFGGQITEGKSVGAAALAMFALNYLQSVLGDASYTSVVAPQVGTLLTGEIDPQGRVLRIEYLEQKVQCAIDEYGPDLKVIVPDREPLPTHLENSIKSGNIFYVGTVEELLAAVLSTRGDSRGLGRAREAVFKARPPNEIAELAHHLLPDVPDEIYYKGFGWTEPVPHEQGVYSLTKAWNDRLDIALGPDAFSLTHDAPDQSQQKKLIQVILDGSAVMDGHWTPDPASGVSRMAIALYEIARSIDPAKEELVFGFLSSQHFEAYDHVRHADARSLEPILQERRGKMSLRRRGPFMRPARQQSIDLYADRQKRIYILSESDIPDLDDVADARVESFESLRLFPMKSAASLGGGSGRAGDWQGSDQRAVFSEESKTDQELLSRYFHKQAATMPEIELDIGADLPVEWEPVEATVSRLDARYVLRSQNAKAIQWKFRVRLATQYPHQVTVKGSLTRDKQESNYSFTAFPAVTSLPPLQSAPEGELTAEEFELWKSISEPDGVCPDCQSQGVHIFHESSHGITRRLIFPSLAELKSGWLVLRAAERRWLFFKTGCQIEGLSIALVDEKLQRSEAGGHLAPIPDAPEGGGLYRLDNQRGTFYLSRI